MEEKKLTRRAALACLGSGAAVAIGGSFGFDSVAAGRGVSVAVASNDALLGVVGQGPVQKNQREAMVELTNNTDSQMEITVSLDNCADGTLFDNEGGSGCSVTFTLGSGNSQFVDINADVTGTIPYSISASAGNLNIDASETVESEPGNIKGAVRIKKPKNNGDFTANMSEGRFEVRQVDIEDNDGDTDLVEVRFRVREGGSGGTVVGSKDVTFSPSAEYDPSSQGNDPEEVITADEPIQSGKTYALTVTGEDEDGNTDSETVEDTT